MSSPFVDHSGKQFSNWTILGFAGRDVHNQALWNCLCACGTQKILPISSIRDGRSKSCGCMRYKITADKNTTHGMAGTPTYKSWHGMLQRVQGKGGHESYPERGISVVDEWLSFDQFFKDMGLRPKGMTLDRIDNNKGYSPENCRWATSKQQSNNRSNTKMVLVDGEHLPLMVACEKYGIGISCVRHRMRKGMSAEMALKLNLKESRVNVGAMTDNDVRQCFYEAYQEIKDRRGHMNEAGIFVKESK